MSGLFSKQRPHSALDCDGREGSSRRHFLKTGVFGFMGLGMLDLMKLSVLADGTDATTCDSVILVWLAGGPSHIDTWDPKPGQDTGGPFKAISTSADGIQICEHLPLIAKQMKHASLIRSFTNKEGSHQRATYQWHTGYAPLGSIEHPSLGSLALHEIGKRTKDIPGYISIGRESYGAGFLGTQVAPFYIGNPKNATKNLKRFKDVDEKRFKGRMDLLHTFDKRFMDAHGKTESIKGDALHVQHAIQMMQSTSVDAFDLSKESEVYLKGYGEDSFGKGLLMARRLVEKGVRFVEVSMGGWDTHAENFERVESNCQKLDPALASLIDDLNTRGMLKRTMVICMGEFGRTPKINARGGRDHYPKVWSGLVAGGGIKAGYIHGASDARGAAVKDDPVKPGALHATMFQALGVNYTKENYTPQGRPIRIVDQEKPIKKLMI